MNQKKEFLIFTIFVLSLVSIGFAAGHLFTIETTEKLTDSMSLDANITPESSVEVQNRIPGINVTEEISIKNQKNNYIQANHHKINYTVSEDQMTVKDVDKMMKLSGSSMRPTIFTGHTLLLDEYNGGDLSEGEIAVFDKNNKTYIHRISGNYLKTNADYITTRGDNNIGVEKVKKEKIRYIVLGTLYTEKG